MSHKKYIKRGNKVFGPYIYENYRVNGKTKTRYLGKGDIPAEGEINKKRFTERLRGNSGIYLKTFIVIGLVFALGIGGYFFFNGATGRATLDVASSYIYGENLSGNLVLRLKQGELIPLDSKLIIENGGNARTVLLSEIMGANSSGSFFVEGFNLSGQGEGAGFAGVRLVYPEINFVFKIVKAKSEKNESETAVNESLINESAGGSSEIPVENTTEIAPDISVGENITETTPTTETETPTETTPTTETTISSETGTSLITGGTVMGEAAGGKVSRDNPFRYNAGNNEDMEIISVDRGSVGELKKLRLENEIIITTNYSEEIEGFGQEYLGEKEKTFRISLAGLGIGAEGGKLTVKLIYQDVVLAEASKKISVENLTGEIKNETLTNETALNLSSKNATLRQYKAVINKPVKWLKKLNQDSENPIQFIEIPKESSNITIKTGDEIALAEKNAEDSKKIVDETSRESLITGNIVFQSNKRGIFTRFLSWLGITGKIISEAEIENSISETSDSKIIDISGIAGGESEIAVEYETPAPISTEQDIPNGKRIVISSGEYNYSDILAYANVPNKIKTENNKSIRLYHYVWSGASLIEEVNENNLTKVVNETVDEEINQTESIVVNQTEVIISEEINQSSVAADKREEKTEENEEKTEEKNKAEKGKSNQKGIIGNVALDLKNVTTGNGNVAKIGGHWRREETEFDAYDLDEDGFIDYIEWNVEHLSEQIYEIIYITKAEHLDSNYTFIEDVYEQVKALDGNYTLIPDGNYLRVTFEQPLTNKKDITIYARAENETNQSMECYDNETEILTENGWKYFRDLKENEKVMTLNAETMEKELQQPTERQDFDNNGGMYKIILEDGSNLLVSKEHKVYSKFMPNDLSSSTSSLVLNTLTNGCLLKCSSLDQIGVDLESASAKYDASSLSGIDESACSRKDSNDSSGTKVILSLINLSNSSSSSGDRELNSRILSLCSFISSSSCFGEYKSMPFKNNIFLVMPNPVSPVNIIPASMTNFIYFNERDDFFNLSRMDLLTLLANSSASFSVSLDLETNSWNLSYPSVSSTLLANASLATSDQLITLNTSIFFLSSSGIDIVKCSILNLSCVGMTQNTQQIHVYKSFGSDESLLNGDSQIINNAWEVINGNSQGYEILDGGLVGLSNYNNLNDADDNNNNQIEDNYANGNEMDSINLSDFSLNKITDVYSDFNSGKEIYFLNSENKPIKVKSITKQQYSGKIYDVDVPNDIVLVRRNNHENNNLINNSGSDNVNSNSQGLAGLDDGLGVNEDGDWDNGLDMAGAFWSGNSNNGTAVGQASQTSAGKFGKGFSFDGSGDYMKISNDSSLSGTKQTYSVWFKISSTLDANKGIIWKAVDTGWKQEYSIFVEYPSGLIDSWFTDGVSQQIHLKSVTIPIVGNWYHVVVTKDNKNLTLYVNGVMENNTNVSWTPNTNTNALEFGRVSSASLSTRYFNGTIDDVLIFNRSLSAQEIKALYNATANQYYNNFTGLADGTYNFTGYAVDLGGNRNNTEMRSVSVDTTYPIVNITYPINGTNYNINVSAINYTLTETNPSRCWYSNSSGVWNSTSQASGTNFTNVISKEGSNTWTVWCNDTNNNVNSSSVSFNIDAIAPAISIISPANNSNFNSTTITFNVSSNEALSWCGLSLDSSANLTMTNYSSTGANLTNSTMSQGTHSFVVSCNDTSGNVGIKSGSGILVDTIRPAINFTGQTPNNGSTQSTNSIFVNISSSDANQHYAFTNWQNSLVGWWTMDDVNQTDLGAKVYDISGNGNNGTAVGNANQTLAGKFGKGFSFDGDGDSITTSASSNWNLSRAGALTYSVWINTNSNASSGLRNIISKLNYCYGLGYGGVGLVYDGANNRFWITYINQLGDSQSTFFGTGNANLAVGAWYHIGIMINSTNASLYRNGALLSTIGAVPFHDSNRAINLGIKDSGCAINEWNGTIDDVLIFNRSLSASEILSLYNATANQYYNNFTGLADGTYNFTGYAVDLGGNRNNTEMRSVSVDTTYPIVNITYPINGTNYNINVSAINYTLTETNPSRCWYSNSSGVWNSTSQAAGTNFTNVISKAGSNTWTVWCNDTNNNVNSSSVSFFSGYLVTKCMNITEAGTYTLQNNVNSTGTCFTISANNISLNGNGFTVSSNITRLGGIYAYEYNLVGDITSISVASGGDNYGIGDEIYFNANGNGNAIAVVDGIDGRDAGITYAHTDNPGSGYSVYDLVQVDDGNYDALITITGVDGSGVVTDWEIYAQGSGYPAYTYGIATSYGGSGTGFTIYTTNTVVGPVTSASITTAGTGYQTSGPLSTTTNVEGSSASFYVNAGSSGAYPFEGYYGGGLIYYEIRPYKIIDGTKYFTSSGATGSLYAYGEYDYGDADIHWNSATGDFDGYRITMDDVTSGYSYCGYAGDHYHDIANNVDTAYLDNVGCSDWVNTECDGANCYPNVTNVTSGGNSSGIIASSFNNLTISNITVTGFYDGISLTSSSNNALFNLNSSGNSNHGIFLSSSSNNNISSITANTNTQNGIYLGSSSNNNQLSNITANTNSYGLFLHSSSNNNISSITANTNNIGIVIATSSNNILSNINSSLNTQFGLYLTSSSNNNLSNITSNSNNNGLYLTSSSNNTLSTITANSNTQFGLYFYSSSNNQLSTITTNSNNKGLYLYSSSNNTLSSITTNSNNYIGLYLTSSSNNNLSNITSNSNNNGLYLTSSSNNRFSNLSIQNASSYGIYSSQSVNNTFSTGIVDSNKNTGVYITSSPNNTFQNFIINNNTNYGIYLTSSTTIGNKFNNIIITNSTKEGVYLSSVQYNSFVNITVANNGLSGSIYNGVYLTGSSGNQFINATANNNPNAGFMMVSSQANILNNVTANNNLYGFSFSASMGCQVSNSYTSGNTYGFSIGAQGSIAVSNFTSQGERNAIYFPYTGTSTAYNTFTDGIINGSIGHAVLVESGGALFNFTRVNITNTNVSARDFFADMGGPLSNFIDTPIQKYYISSIWGGLYSFENTKLGKIQFTSDINGTGVNLIGNSTSDIRILNNSAYVNSAKTGLNKSANITLYNIGDRGYTTPAILRDGANCPVGICTNYTSLTATNVIFSVTGWSNYSIGNSTNTAPTISLTSPPNGNISTNRTPTFTYLGSDSESDVLVYHINITCIGRTDNTLVSNYSGTSYTLTSELLYLHDNGYYYQWSVKACENATAEKYCSSWSDSWAINISSFLEISLPTDTVNFGDMNPGDSKNTTNDTVAPIVIRNSGNSLINVSMNATQLWTSIAYEPTNYFMSKIRVYLGNASWANDTWFQLPSITGAITAVDRLNYHTGNNTLKVDMLATVPSGEEPGNKSSQVNFRASLAES